jgi:hypothetical protein
MSCRQIWSQKEVQWQWQPSNFHNVMFWGEAFPGLGGSGYRRFDSGWCFISIRWRKEERRKEKKKRKIAMKRDGFPGARPALQDVPWVAAVR